MTVRQTVKCDNDKCNNAHEMDEMIPPDMLIHNLPHSWVVVARLDTPAMYWAYFCSQDCFREALVIKPTEKTVELDSIPLMCKPLPDGRIQALASGEVYQLVKQEQECKARRFLLVDGETADITEGVLWGSEYVSLEEVRKGFPVHYLSWDAFKDQNEGSGVQWIDRADPRTGGVIAPGTLAMVDEAGTGHE